MIADTPVQSGPIAVYGASGYTGRLVAAELRRRGAETVLAGRNPAKLEMVAEELGARFRVAAVPLDDAAGLRELLEPCSAVIDCAGPFLRHGEPVLAAAVDARTHYLDTTGEQPYMRMVFERYGPRAEQRGVALVTAMGFDYVPGDMLSALVAEGMGDLDEITVAYGVRGFVPTRGTSSSAIEIMRHSGVEWRDGDWVATSGLRPGGSWSFPPPVGRQATVRWPAGEQITVPRHVNTRRVTTLLGAGMLVPAPLGRVVPLTVMPLQLALRTPLARVAKAVTNRLPEGPSDAQRAAVRFAVACEARAGQRRRSGVVTGPDVYGITATFTVHGALLAAEPGYDRAGALAQSQAFDPGPFLDELAAAGIGYEVGALPAGASG